MKAIAILLFLISIVWTLKDKKKVSWCPPDNCYNEGECTNSSGHISCKCISDMYFTGPYCNITYNHCADPALCNGGRCVNVIGQPMCTNCPIGTSGQFCNRNMSGPRDLLLTFNHYGFVGKEHLFLFTLSYLGGVKFTVHLTTDKYAIELFRTDPDDKKEWLQHHKLSFLARHIDITMWNNFPYENGFYHISKQTFWQPGIENVKLTITIHGGKKIYYRLFKLLIVETKAMTICHPKVKFPFDVTPNNPLNIEAARYTIIEAMVIKRCRPHSDMIFYWSIYNMIGSKLIKKYKGIVRPILKIEPYLLSKMFDNLFISNRIELTFIEEYDGFRARGSEICYVRISMKPARAIIAGGLERQINVDQPFYLDGRSSRNYLFAPSDQKALIYEWGCLPADDFYDPDCMLEMGNFAYMKYPQQYFLQSQKYLIILKVSSPILSKTSVTSQILYVSKIHRLEVHIDCVRNCENRLFYRNESIHLKARCPECEDFYSTYYEWNTGEHYNRTKNLRSDYFRVLINVDPDHSNKLRVTVDVSYKGLEGSCSIVLTENKPPKVGKIVVKPKLGACFQTQISISFEKFRDKYKNLLRYEVYVYDYLVFRTYDTSAFTRLPPTKGLNVKICDLFNVCMEKDIAITINKFTKDRSISRHFDKYIKQIKQLIIDGNISEGVLLTHLLATEMKNLKQLKELVNAIRTLKLMTLADVRNMLTLTATFSNYSSPLTYQHAKVLGTCLRMIRKGLEFILKDGEYKDLTRDELLFLVQKLLSTIYIFATKTESHPTPRIVREPAIKAHDPLAEDMEPPLVIDTEVLQQIDYWLTASIDLTRCLHLLGLLQNNLIFPYEESQSIEVNKSVLYLHAFDSFKTKNNLTYNITSSQLVLTKSLIAKIGSATKCDEVGIQVGALVGKDLFWWCPEYYDITSDNVYFNIYPKGKYDLKSKTINLRKNKLYIDMRLKRKKKRRFSYIHRKFSDELGAGILRGSFDGILEDDHVVRIYVIEVPPRSLLYVTFLQNSEKIAVKLTIKKRSKSHQIKKSGLVIEANSTENKTLSVLNKFKKKVEGYLGVMVVENTTTNATFRFRSVIQQCLTWSFDREDPDWTTDYCMPIGAVEKDFIRCECEHLSIFSARYHPVIISEDLDSHYLIDELQYNWYHLQFQGICLLFLLLVLFVVLIRLMKHSNILATSLDDPKDRRLQVSFISGGHPNATTTSNIRICIISDHEVHNAVIYQSCVRPQLRQNSTCDIYLPAFETENTVPYRIKLSMVSAGRFPSWFCNKVVIKDRKYKRIYVYQVRKWFFPGKVYTLSNAVPMNKIRDSFWNSLSTAYKNWYQFQPLLGEYLNEHLDLFERTCIWMWQFVSTVCIVAIFYGRTTLENYEEERETYRYVYFDIRVILALGAVTYTVNMLIHIVFTHIIFF